MIKPVKVLRDDIYVQFLIVLCTICQNGLSADSYHTMGTNCAPLISELLFYIVINYNLYKKIHKGIFQTGFCGPV